MLHVILYQPEIPQNTGNIGRMCAITRTRLHLIHPLGFAINDRNLKRSGLDYWSELDVCEHPDWAHFRASSRRPNRLFLLTTKAQTPYWDTAFRDGDGFVFGRESAGVPTWLHDELSATRLTIPQPNPDCRSLNLATSAGIVIYEALRQQSTLPQ